VWEKHNPSLFVLLNYAKVRELIEPFLALIPEGVSLILRGRSEKHAPASEHLSH
jgi:hypothetical protein